MLILEGVGAMGSESPYTRIVLIEGTVELGTFVALVGAATDNNNDGRVDSGDFDATLSASRPTRDPTGQRFVCEKWR